MAFTGMRKHDFLTGLWFILLTLALTGCGSVSAAPLPAATGLPSPAVKILTATATLTPTPAPPSLTSTPAATRTPAASPTPDPAQWMDWPVVPTALSARARQIYAEGLAAGNRAGTFSKVGDCGGTPSWFLGDFDRGPRNYDLGPYPELEAVIAAYPGSFERASLAVRNGFTASGVLLPLWADRKQCDADESPLACELRLHRPAIALIMLGTNSAPRAERFEAELRKVIDETIARGVLPVLATKADNLEGDHRINAAVARLAAEYELPVWNYWRAVQDLPGAGLQDDGGHLTWAPNDFSDPRNLQSAWPVRNLTALQVLDYLRGELDEEKP